MNNPQIIDQFQLLFVYRGHKEYQIAVEREFLDSILKKPLNLLSNDTRFYNWYKSKSNRWLTALKVAPFHLIEKTGIFSFFNFIRLYLVFRREKPTLLHINNGGYPGARTCEMAVLSASLAGVKNIILQVNNLAEPQKNGWDRFIDRKVNEKVNYFITASKQAKSRLVDYRKMSEAKTIQIYNALIQPTISKSPEDLREEFGIDKSSFVILEVALLSERKGQIYLLKAISELKKNCPSEFENIKVLLIGDGEDKIKLQEYITNNDLDKAVLLLGQRQDYYDFINLCDLFLLPSIKDEDMPLVILSAMSLGKPILSTNLAGISEEIENEKSGILLEVDQLDGLWKTLLKMYQNRNHIHELGEQALQRYQQYFLYDMIMQKYIQLYNSILHGENHYESE